MDERRKYLRKISLENYKCFRSTQEIQLTPITLMYGKNGRGKSSVAQALLMLGQTMRVNNGIDKLFFTGEFVKQGTFEDIKSRPSNGEEIKIDLESSDGESLKLGFLTDDRRSQIARLRTFVVNGHDRLEEKGSSEETSSSEEKTVGVTSDVRILQNLKKISFVSAGRLGPVNAVDRNDALRPDWVGVNGENLINVLANKGEAFIKTVEKELSRILSGAAVRISDPKADRIELFLNSSDGESRFRPNNVGFGYSYILPVIVTALLAEEGSILVVENPEAHLHPGAQSRLTKFLIEIAKEKNLQLLIETHSDHVVNGMRIAVKNKDLIPSDCLIVHFSHEDKETNPVVDFIHCDKNGTLSTYPDDFMDEWTEQMMKLV